MSEEIAASEPEFKNHGWRVTFAGMGINLALGILYTWSVIAGGIPEDWGWSQADKAPPQWGQAERLQTTGRPAGRRSISTPRKLPTKGAARSIMIASGLGQVFMGSRSRGTPRRRFPARRRGVGRLR